MSQDGVDPRARGGDLRKTGRELTKYGRSPRTRGRQDTVDAYNTDLGSIPAHAGETIWRQTPPSPPGVDPRARGGDELLEFGVLLNQGRSPRTRGRLVLNLLLTGRMRSIPAHAGETLQCAKASQGKGVDPRARGGDAEECAELLRIEGRSPRTRGRHILLFSNKSNIRSIPAHAGETQ